MQLKEIQVGYTHYFYRPEKLDQSKFNQAVADCQALCKAINAPICYEYDLPNKPAAFLPTKVWFNGIGEDGHETFVIEQSFTTSKYDSKNEKEQYFSCCKTARKPYDIAVVACLIIFKHYFGDDFSVSSDGRKVNWKEGLEAVQKHLGYGEIPENIGLNQ